MWEFQICLGMRTRMVFAQRLVEVTMPIGISLFFSLFFLFFSCVRWFGLSEVGGGGGGGGGVALFR